MELEQQIKLVDDLINQRRDRTVRDFIRIRKVIEDYDLPTRKLTLKIIDNGKDQSMHSKGGGRI